MPKRRPMDAEVRAQRDRAFRRLKALCETHWSMLGSWLVADKPDRELELRLQNSRASIVSLIEAMLPMPGTPLAIKDEAITDQSRSVH